MAHAAGNEHLVAGHGLDDVVADAEAVAPGQHEHGLVGIGVRVGFGRSRHVRAVEDGEGPRRSLAVEEDADGVAAREAEHLAVTVLGEALTVDCSHRPTVRRRGQGHG